MRVRLDLLHRRGQLLGDRWPGCLFDDPSILVEHAERDRRVRVHDRGHAQVLVDGFAPLLVTRLHARFDHHAMWDVNTVFVEPDVPSVVALQGSITLGVDSDVHMHSHPFFGYLGDDVRVLPRRQLRIHHHPGDSDSLLPPGLADGVEA